MEIKRVLRRREELERIERGFCKFGLRYEGKARGVLWGMVFVKGEKKEKIGKGFFLDLVKGLILRFFWLIF